MSSSPASTDPDLVRYYLDGIGKYPLLTKDQEEALAQKIETGRAAAEALAAPERPSPAKARRLRREVSDGEEATRQFVNANLRLVVSIAKRYRGTGAPLLDLVQDGNLGLIHAVEKFDWHKGFKFSTYATWWIRQAIERGLANDSTTVRLPTHVRDHLRRLGAIRSELAASLSRPPTLAELAEAMSMPEQQVSNLLSAEETSSPASLDLPIGEDGETELSDVVTDRQAPSPLDLVVARALPGEVRSLLSALSDRERQVVSMRFGLDDGVPRTFEEISKAMGTTRQWARQIERIALAKLRHPSAGDAARSLLAS